MAETTATPHHPDIASSSTAPRSASTPDDYFDIFVHHSPDETGDFAMELCKLLVGRGLVVFLDGIEKEVTPRVEAAISLASLQIAIFSENYVSCKWCMDTLVQMTKSEAPILPLFYQVEPSDLRHTGQGGKGPYAQWLCDHEGSYESQTMQGWRKALENVSNRKGFELKKRNVGEEELLRRDEKELLCKIVENVQSVVSMIKAQFYHVFICHRGETKEKFAEPLYLRLRSLPGLRVFLDKPELVAAYRIEPQIEAAIQFASVNIVIFSPRFPESSWCLDELTLMQTCGAKILPVFYEMKPDVNGFYSTVLSHLMRRRQDTQTIKRWRGALANVPKSDDLMLAGNEENKEALMSKIVERVLEYIPEPSELSRQSYELQRAVESILAEDVSKQSKVIPTAPVKECYIGLREKAFEKWVLSQVEEQPVEAKVVGILGAVGVGKTTLAKFFCKISKFKECSVLFNLRERALKDLEGKVIEDFKHSPNIEVESVKQHLPSCDALAVILDEVDHVDQLVALLPIKNVLHPKSLILVTSSAKDVLTMSGISDSSIYHLAGLNREDSRKLLLSYAFYLPYLGHPSYYHLLGLNRQDLQNLLLSYDLDPLFPRHPSDDPLFESLVGKFVMACDGLPLPLKELGERLSGKDRSGWEEQLNQLRHNCIPPLKIEHKLNICYDSLNEVEQQIFLDVACFFIGEDSDSATRIFGMEGLKKLENRCLLQVTSKIEMNELLRNYGRNKANGLTPRRLWHQETKQINDLLEKSSSELAQFCGITMNGDRGDETEMPCCKQSGETFSGSGNLKFLAAQGGYVEKILTRVRSPDLLWLKWNKCTHSSLPPWISMENLRVLEVDGSKLTELWQTESQVPLQLRELNICAPLLRFPQSIGQLKFLEKIVVEYSGPLPLQDLPDSFGHLANLQYLDLKGASHLKMLRKSFGKLTQLKYLFLEGCSEIRVLPGLEQFTSLKTLDVRGCKNLKSIPELGQLKKLQMLDVSGCSQIKSLSGLEHLNSLETFIVSGCQKLQSIPGLGQLTKLPELNVSGCSEIKLLPGLEKLTSLESFNISGCQKLQSIGGLGKLTKLQTLDVSGCSEIQTLPGLKHLTSLETFNVGGCEKLQSIDVSGSREIHTLSGLEHLTSLKKLNVSGCNKLQRLPSLGLLTKLKTIDVSGCCEIQSLLGLEHLTSLKTLNVSGCEKLQSIRGLRQLRKLQILNLSRCYEIRELSGVKLLTSLETLNISGCKNLQNIGWLWLGQLRKLQTLDVGGCQIRRLLGLKYLTSLKKLNVSGCNVILELPGVERLTSLETLNVSKCWRLESIPELGQLTKLQILNVSGCSKIRDLPGVNRLTSLKTLNVSLCWGLKSIPELGQLTKLETLDASWSNIQSLSGLENLTSLKTLEIWRCDELQRMPRLEHLTSLETLTLSELKLIESIPGLGQLKKLRILKLSGLYSLRELPSLEHLTSLETLTLSQLKLIESIPGLGQLKKLRILEFSDLYRLRELPSLEHLTSLETLTLSDLYSLRELPSLQHLTSLETLTLSKLKLIESIPGLGQLKKLRILKLSGLFSLRELPSLQHLTSLETLTLYYLSGLRELPSLEHLTSLETLTLYSLELIESIPGLGQLKKLQTLDISQMNMETLPSLGHLTSLQSLRVYVCPSLRSIPSLEHLTNLEKLEVHVCPSLRSIPSLEHLTNLEKLEVHGCGEIKSLQVWAHLISLKKLSVCGCKKLESMPGLGLLPKLERLDVIRCRQIQSLPGLERLVSLKVLQVGDISHYCLAPSFYEKCGLLTLQGLEHLNSLESLNVTECKELGSIPQLRFLEKLKRLNVERCPKIQDLPGVEHAMSLESLRVFLCPRVRWGRGVLEQLRQRGTHLNGDAFTGSDPYGFAFRGSDSD